MTSFTDVFGGSTVQPADVGFRAVTLTASITTVWPPFATSGDQLARIMKVDASAGPFSVTLPDATLASAGQDVIFDNAGSNSFNVLDAAGNSLATLTAGQVKYFYLAGNATAAGTWRITLFGVGSSALDASALAGKGLSPLSNTLNLAAPLTSISGDTTVALTDRATVFLWTGGSGTLTLPSTTASTSDFQIEVRNQGTGTLTITPAGISEIDGGATVALSVNESCFVHMGASDWYTVGRGRNTAFNFTQLSKSVTGGTTDLTLTEASNVVQTYTGTLTSNQIVRLPAVVQVYYISNATSGAYTLTFKCVTPGSASVAVTQGQAAILFCDGLSVINANTSLAGGITSIVFAAASAAAPSCTISTSGNGFYAPGANQIGVAISGTAVGKWDSTGYSAVATGDALVASVSTGGMAHMVLDRPAGQIGSLCFKTAGVDRWKYNVSAAAESGSDAGSNLTLAAYDDAGSALGPVYTISRATQVITFIKSVVANLTGNVTGNVSGNVTGNVAGNVTGNLTATLTKTSETVYGITDGAAFEIDPANGGMQTVTLGADRTPKATNFAAGQSVTLHVNDGTARTLTWTDATFGASGVVWLNGVSPTLATSGYTVIELWKVGTQVYGTSPGSVA